MRTLALLALSATFASAASAQLSLNIRIGGAPDHPIVGLPFCADLSVSVVQLLVNGQTLTHQVAGHICRSATGLERYEASFPATDPAQPATTLICLVDHEKHTATNLNSRLQTATIQHLPENATVTVAFLPQPRTQATPAIKPADTVITDLGKRKDGLRDLTGKRITATIPPGRMGNDQPILIVSNVWAIQALHLIVSEETRDPINGDRTTHLTNIRTEEPDPALFVIPESYSIKERSVSGTPPAGSLASAPAAAPTPQVEEALNSSDPSLRTLVAYALANNNDHLADAETLARDAVRIVEQRAADAVADGDPPQAFATMSALSSFWDTLAWVYFREGNQKQAEAFARAAFELKPNPEYCSHLGRIYEAEGRPKDAVTIYQMALSKKSSPAALDFFQTRLAQLGNNGAAAIPMEVITHLPALKPPLADGTNVLLNVTLTRDQPATVNYIKVRPPNEPAVTAAIQSALATNLPDNGPETILRRAHLSCTSGDAATCSLYFLSSEDLKRTPLPANN